MVRFGIGMVLTVWIILSCGGQKRPSMTDAEKERLEALVRGQRFSIAGQWAYPYANQSMTALANAGLLAPGNTANQISITGTGSYLRVKNDSVFAELPYYGEQQFGGAYNSTTAGIVFKGALEDWEVRFNEKKKRYEFGFTTTNNEGEGFVVNGMVFPNLSASWNVNSTHRRTIGYSGHAEGLELRAANP